MIEQCIVVIRREPCFTAVTVLCLVRRCPQIAVKRELQAPFGFDTVGKRRSIPGHSGKPIPHSLIPEAIFH